MFVLDKGERRPPVAKGPVRLGSRRRAGGHGGDHAIGTFKCRRGLFCAFCLFAGPPAEATDLPEEEELVDPEGTGLGSVELVDQLFAGQVNRTACQEQQERPPGSLCRGNGQTEPAASKMEPTLADT
jgi:hypothetical protein